MTEVIRTTISVATRSSIDALAATGVLTKAHEARIQTLLALASEMDRSINASMVKEYRALLEPLEALMPPPADPDDEMPGLDPVP